LPSTVAPVMELAPLVLRVGGYNNDTNTPDPFDDAEIDLAVGYANSIGAQIILQVPLLADVTGAMPTAGTAAEMVKYTNVTKAYGVKYFSIGNEPDLYPDATGTTEGIKGFTPVAYCASATAYATAMKAADPTIKIVGPDLSWKYQAGANDWLTPILQTCGSLFDIVAIHRYPIDPAQTTIAAAAADASQLRGTIAHVRSIMQATGNGDKPLAITECNITWDGSPEKSILPASPGTVPAGMWAADARGVGLETGLWTRPPSSGAPARVGRWACSPPRLGSPNRNTGRWISSRPTSDLPCSRCRRPRRAFTPTPATTPRTTPPRLWS
jgi:Glycoside hydrolase family 44